MKKSRVITTELYENVDGWYVTVKKTETDTTTFYDLEKEKQDNHRSRSSLQVYENEARVLLSLLKEILEVKE